MTKINIILLAWNSLLRKKHMRQEKQEQPPGSWPEAGQGRRGEGPQLDARWWETGEGSQGGGGKEGGGEGEHLS
jgi:hypothetical protein